MWTGNQRTISTNWAYVDVDWLVKIKPESTGNVIYEKWARPKDANGVELRTVLTKPKILTVPIELEVRERRNAQTRYVLKAADYQCLVDAVKE